MGDHSLTKRLPTMTHFEQAPEQLSTPTTETSLFNQIDMSEFQPTSSPRSSDLPTGNTMRVDPETEEFVDDSGYPQPVQVNGLQSSREPASSSEIVAMGFPAAETILDDYDDDFDNPDVAQEFWEDAMYGPEPV